MYSPLTMALLLLLGMGAFVCVLLLQIARRLARVLHLVERLAAWTARTRPEPARPPDARPAPGQGGMLPDQGGTTTYLRYRAWRRATTPASTPHTTPGTARRSSAGLAPRLDAVARGALMPSRRFGMCQRHGWLTAG